MSADTARVPLQNNPLRGQLVGDRNGGPVRLALLVGQSLAEKGRFDREDIVDRYVEWHRDGAFDTGRVWRYAIAQIADGHPSGDAARLVNAVLDGMTGGVNPAHRCVALACAHFISDDDLPEVARDEAKITHQHEDAAEAAAATVVIIRALLRHASFEDALDAASAATSGTVQRFVRADRRVDTGGYAPHVLHAAIHFTRTSDSFGSAVAASIDFAGADNYCPVLVGAFAAARFGLADARDLQVDPRLAVTADNVFRSLWSAAA